MKRKIGVYFIFCLILLYLSYNFAAFADVIKENKDIKFIIPKMFFLDGNYIYYIDQRDSFIYRVKTDGNVRKNIGNSRVYTDGMLLSGMIVDDKYVYYINDSDNKKLYRINKDGTGRVCISKRSIDPSDGFYLLNNYIYYFSNNKFYKISTNGKEYKLDSKDKELCSYYFNSFKKTYCNNYFYFLLRDGIYKVKSDGSDKRKLVSGGIYDFKVADSSVYYINEKDLCLYKDGCKIINSRVLQDTGDEWIGNFDINNGYIYYTNADDDMRLYKMNIITKEITKISDIKAVSFKVDDEIYYINSFDRGRLYKASLDGKEKKDIAKGDLLYIYDVEKDFIFYSAKWEKEEDFYLGRCLAADKNGKVVIELN